MWDTTTKRRKEKMSMFEEIKLLLDPIKVDRFFFRELVVED